MSREQRAESSEQRALSRARRSRRGDQQRAPLSRIERGAAQRRGEVPKASTPGVLRRLRLLRMTLALLLRKTGSSLALGMTSVLASSSLALGMTSLLVGSSLALGMTSLLVVLAGWMPVSAQEITYNLEPTHELGPELWSIPIGGRLTMSADGTCMLVASLADSAFYVVDVETGEYRRTPARFYADNTYGFTYYRVDNDLDVLVEGGNWVENGERVWDLNADTLITTLSDIGVILAISDDLDRVATSFGVYVLSSSEKVSAISSPINQFAWFDESKGLLYRTADRNLAEVDAASGNTNRTWGIRPLRSEVRRPSNSDWLYVFSLETDFANPQNWVEAINLVTGERLTFEKYFWERVDGQPEYREVFSAFTGSSTGCIWRGINGDHLNPVWYASAEDRSSQVILDTKFMVDGRSRSKIMAVTPTLSQVMHCRNTNFQSETTCNALVPVTTSVEEQRAESTEQRAESTEHRAQSTEQRAQNAECWLSGEVARIYNVLGVELARLPLNSSGELSASHLEALPMQPLWAVSGDCVQRVR